MQKVNELRSKTKDYIANYRLSQAQLAELLGITPAAISRFLTGTTGLSAESALQLLDLIKRDQISFSQTSKSSREFEKLYNSLGSVEKDSIVTLMKSFHKEKSKGGR